MFQGRANAATEAGCPGSPKKIGRGYSRNLDAGPFQLMIGRTRAAGLPLREARSGRCRAEDQDARLSRGRGGSPGSRRGPRT